MKLVSTGLGSISGYSLSLSLWDMMAAEGGDWLARCLLGLRTPPRPPPPTSSHQKSWVDQTAAGGGQPRGQFAKGILFVVCCGVLQQRRPVPPEPTCLGLGERRGQELPRSQKAEGWERSTWRHRRETGHLSLGEGQCPTEERNCPETWGTRQLLTPPQLRLLISPLVWAGMGSFK